MVYGRQVPRCAASGRGTRSVLKTIDLVPVAQAVLGRGKTLQADEDDTMPEAIAHAYVHDRTAFCDYCAEGARRCGICCKPKGS